MKSSRSSTMTYIGMMTALYGLLIMGAVYAANSISVQSPVTTMNGISQSLAASLGGVSSLLMLFGALLLIIGLFLWKGDKD